MRSTQHRLDDQLLDAVGRSTLPPDADGVATLLAEWRDDLAAGIQPVDFDPATIRPVDLDPATVRPVDLDPATVQLVDLDPEKIRPPAPAPARLPRARRSHTRRPQKRQPHAERPGAQQPKAQRPQADLPRPQQPRLRRPRARRLLAGAVAAVIFAGGGSVAVAAADARPGSPWWPVTQLLYPDQAESRAAQQDIEEILVRARAAVADQRYAEAAALLEKADPLLARVLDPAVQQQLRDELLAIRRLVPKEVAGLELPLLPESPLLPPAETDEEPADDDPPPAEEAETPGPLPDLPELPELPGLPLPELPLPTLPPIDPTLPPLLG